MMRGEIWWVDFGEPFGSDPAFRRPAVIVQNDGFNASQMHTTIAVPLTTNLRLADFPCNILLDAKSSGLPKDSVAVLPQISAIDKGRLVGRVGTLPRSVMLSMNANLRELLDV